MKKYYILAVSLVIVGCGGGGGDSPETSSTSTTISTSTTTSSNSFNYSYSGSGHGIYLLDTPQTDTSTTTISLSLSLDTAVKDVYAIFTNVTDSDLSDHPVVAEQVKKTTQQQLEEAKIASDKQLDWAINNSIGINGKADITLFNSNPSLYGNIMMQNRSIYKMPPPPEPSKDMVNTTHTFYPGSTTADPIAATCRTVVGPINGKTLNIWVADDSWTGAATGKNRYVTQTMVETLADKFLSSEDGEDIYGWVNNIYGDEWGSHSYSDLITDNDEITILLYDIDNDNSISGGTLGFFYAKDNFKSTRVAGSNERLMFYIDAIMWADDGEGGSGNWSISDHWPNELLGTLAHEFQHMIHFYQKDILRESPSETFLNEMASMVTEDFVQTKIQTSGPRNVSYLDGTEGSAANTGSFLSDFNRYNYLSVTDWYGGIGEKSVYNSYALNYSLGAFILRNYGGPKFFKELVHNAFPDRTAFDSALIAMGYTDDFSTLLRKWGVAVLLSDSNDAPAGYRYNTGAFLDYNYGAFTYNIGSINLFNYEDWPVSGPVIYDSLPPLDVNAGTYKTSNMYYQLGQNLTGDSTHSITLRKGQKLTIVVK